MKAQFDPAVTLTLEHEGGFGRNPKTGEVVNHGITLKLLRQLGILKSTGPTLQSDVEFVQNLTVEDAKDIYYSEFWLKPNIGELESQDVANKVFDLQVNTDHGVIFLQEAINQIDLSNPDYFQRFIKVALTVDGIVGPVTAAAAVCCVPVTLLGHRAVSDIEPGTGIRGFAEKYYRQVVIDNPEDADQLQGWLNRLDS